MIPLLIHFLGYMIVNSAVPPYIGSADAYFLAWWYAAFAAVDLIATSLSSGCVRVVLALSFAWSASLSIECLALQDTLQSRDWLAQILIDGALFVYLILLTLRVRHTHKAF